MNGYQGFVFQHRSSADLTSFDVIRIMAEADSVDLCWVKFNLELLSGGTSTPVGLHITIIISGKYM